MELIFFSRFFVGMNWRLSGKCNRNHRWGKGESLFGYINHPQNFLNLELRNNLERNMELDKFKKLLLNLVVDFLIADYLNWGFLKIFNINLQKFGDWSVDVSKNYPFKKIIIKGKLG
jgi:hypothetical protein